MRYSTSLCVAITVGLLLAACSPAQREPARPAASATTAADAREAARADATRRVQELDAAIADARQRIAATEATPSLTRRQRLVLSETRRAVVVANVSLQKARTALAAGDYAVASQATGGVAEQLKTVAEGKAVTSAQAPGKVRK